MVPALLCLSAVMMTSCTKKNNPPVVAGVVINPASVDEGTATSVTVNASDLDGDPLSYAYQVTGGAIQGSGNAVQWIAPSIAGAHSVTVTVTDGKGGSAVGTGALMVKEVIKETKITGTASFPAGVNGDLTNSKASIYSSLENWNNNSPIRFVAVKGSGSSVTFSLDNVLPGNYYLDVWKDNDNNAIWSAGDFIGWYGSGGLGAPMLTEVQVTQGMTANVTINMLIIPNTPPVIQSLTLTPGRINVGGTVAVAVVATDDDGDPLTYAYQVTGGSIQGTGASVNWIAPNAPGTYSLTITVTDGKGGSVSASASLEVIQQTRISGTISFPAGVTGDLANAAVSLYTSLQNWNNNNAAKTVTVTGTGTQVTFLLDELTPGTYYLDVWKDNDNNRRWSAGDFVGWYGSGGLGAPSLTAITITTGTAITANVSMFIIPNSVPVIQSLTVNPAQVNVGGSATVSVTATDADGDALSYSYQVTGGSIQGAGATVQWNAPNTAGTYTVTVTVTDGKGGSTTANSNLTVTEVARETRISGTARFAAGLTGNLANSLVSIYLTFDDWNEYRPLKTVTVTGTGNSVTFTLTNVTPGSYYLDVWRDLDNDGLWSEGDYVGWYGTGDLGTMNPALLTVPEGVTTTVTITMYII